MDADLEARFTSPNFTINYFGYGNETKDSSYLTWITTVFELIKVMPSINKIGLNGSKFQIQSSYERITGGNY
jgi:hypothetical protein